MSLKLDAKVVLLGKEATGKSTLVERFVRGSYASLGSETSTIGAAFAAKKMKLSDGRTVSLGIWDTAGAERFQSLSRMYYSGARAALVCVDSTNAGSFEKMKFWMSELQEYQPECRRYIVLTKVDLLEAREANGDMGDRKSSDAGNEADQTHSDVALPEGGLGPESPGAVSLTALSSTPTNGSEEIDHEELRRFASSVDAEVMSTSARSGKGVCELFLKVAEDLSAEPPAPSPAASGSLGPQICRIPSLREEAESIKLRQHEGLAHRFKSSCCS